ncbi:MAG: nucleotidyltransferase family protein, partial [Huintestinicola sp.]
KVKVKRYPMARIKRILLNALFGIKTEDLKVPPMYGRILALNDKGAEILRLAGSLPEDKLSVPFSSSLKDFINPKAENKNLMRSIGLNTISNDIYALGSREIRASGMDFTGKVHFEKIEGFVSELPEDLKTTAHTASDAEIERDKAKAAEENAAEKPAEENSDKE